MNTYYNPPTQAGFVPFILEGQPIPQYGYGYGGGGYPRQMGQPDNTSTNAHPPPQARPAEGYTAPPPGYPAPPPAPPPLLVPVYPLYPSVYAPMYPPHPNEIPIPPPPPIIPSVSSSHKSIPPFLPPHTHSTNSHHYHNRYYYRPGSMSPTSSSYTTNDRSTIPPPQSPPPPPPAPRISAHTTTIQPQPQPRITGRYGIHELLNCQPNTHPYIDWQITHDLSLARQWVLPSQSTSSQSERCQSISFETPAVLPPVNNLSIRTTSRNHHTPLGQAILRWGEIRVCRFDRFLSVGDVLHEIWAYFDAPLTEEDERAANISNSSFIHHHHRHHWHHHHHHHHWHRGGIVEQSFQKRCQDPILNNNNTTKTPMIKKRCDTLLDSVRFAGLEIGLDFESCKELYLSLEEPK